MNKTRVGSIPPQCQAHKKPSRAPARDLSQTWSTQTTLPCLLTHGMTCRQCTSLSTYCCAFRVSISCQKTKSIAVLPCSSSVQRTAIHYPNKPPVEPVTNFQYLGSVIHYNRGSDLEVKSRVWKASQAFGSLSYILWYQKNPLSNQAPYLQLRHHSNSALCWVSAGTCTPPAELHGHMSGMPDSWLPKQLLLCTPVLQTTNARSMALRPLGNAIIGGSHLTFKCFQATNVIVLRGTNGHADCLSCIPSPSLRLM